MKFDRRLIIESDIRRALERNLKDLIRMIDNLLKIGNAQSIKLKI